MRRYFFSVFCSSFLLSGWMLTEAQAQPAKAEAHVATAKTIAETPGLYDLTPTFKLLCTERKPIQQRAAAATPANPRIQRVPERSQWYVEPLKVFDNLYNVGTEWYVWAVKTSDGIILLNAGR